MLHRVSAEKIAHSFDRTLKPVLQIKPGDEVIFETRDARGGRAMSDCEQYVVPPPPRPESLNPVTGPIYVEGAERGDTLLVAIDDIKLGIKGYSSVRQDMGVLQDMVEHATARVMEVRGDRILFNDNMSFPTRPMIGTIGVAPLLGPVASVHPGPHGGNMDCNDIMIGARVFLPIYVDGGLLSVGDVHASMGDGEVSGAGLDIAADVGINVRVLKNIHMITPLVQTDSKISIIHNAPKLEQAIRGAVEKSVSLTKERTGLSFEDAFRLVSITGDLRICQACVSSIDVSVRMQLPRSFEVTSHTG